MSLISFSLSTDSLSLLLESFSSKLDKLESEKQGLLERVNKIEKRVAQREGLEQFSEHARMMFIRIL